MFEIQSSQIVDEIEHRKFQDASDALSQDVWLMTPFNDRNGKFHSVPDQADSLVDEINKHIDYDSRHNHVSYDTIQWGDFFAGGVDRHPWKDPNASGEFYFANSDGALDSNYADLDSNPETQLQSREQVSSAPLPVAENPDGNEPSQSCTESTAIDEFIGTVLGHRYLGGFFGAALGASAGYETGSSDCQ